MLTRRAFWRSGGLNFSQFFGYLAPPLSVQLEALNGFSAHKQKRHPHFVGAFPVLVAG
jgi:hypothetical protein